MENCKKPTYIVLRLDPEQPFKQFDLSRKIPLPPPRAPMCTNRGQARLEGAETASSPGGPTRQWHGRDLQVAVPDGVALLMRGRFWLASLVALGILSVVVLVFVVRWSLGLLFV